MKPAIGILGFLGIIAYTYTPSKKNLRKNKISVSSVEIRNLGKFIKVGWAVALPCYLQPRLQAFCLEGKSFEIVKPAEGLVKLSHDSTNRKKVERTYN